jgi:hypothetical protein
MAAGEGGRHDAAAIASSRAAAKGIADALTSLIGSPLVSLAAEVMDDRAAAGIEGRAALHRQEVCAGKRITLAGGPSDVRPVNAVIGERNAAVVAFGDNPTGMRIELRVAAGDRIGAAIRMQVIIAVNDRISAPDDGDGPGGLCRGRRSDDGEREQEGEYLQLQSPRNTS